MEDPSNDSTRVSSLYDFPEHLLLHILSFLPTLDAIQTSLVCRKWRHLWSSIPVLYFSHSLFPHFDSPSETRRYFTEFVDRTLILRPYSPLPKFCLQFDYAEDRYASHVDSWIHYAITHNVVDLDLDFFKGWDFDNYDDNYSSDNDDDEEDDDNASYYNFPFSVLRNGRVRVLKLRYCDISLPINMSGTRFISLLSMSLDGVYLTDQMVSEILVGCVNLETLVLDNICGIKDVKICSSKLRKLLLKGFTCDEGSVDIYAPNLYSLSIVCFHVGKYALRDAVSLVEAEVDVAFPSHWSKVVRLLGHVKRLTMQNRWFELLASKDVLSESFVLYNLKLLDLWTGYSKSDMLGIAALLERSPNLNTMILDHHFELYEEENLSEEFLNKTINFSLPSLRQVKINNFKGTKSELQFIKLLEKQGVVLEKIVLVPAKVCEISLDGLKELKFSMDILHIQCREMEELIQHPEGSQSHVMGEDRHGRIHAYGLGVTPPHFRGPQARLSEVLRMIETERAHRIANEQRITILEQEANALRSEFTQFRSEFTQFSSEFTQFRTLFLSQMGNAQESDASEPVGANSPSSGVNFRSEFTQLRTLFLSQMGSGQQCDASEPVANASPDDNTQPPEDMQH